MIEVMDSILEMSSTDAKELKIRFLHKAMSVILCKQRIFFFEVSLIKWIEPVFQLFPDFCIILL